MMRISTKGRYALRMMLDLAQHAREQAVSLRDIADRQQVTTKYMESIMALLLQEGMVTSIRGKSGGYRLARPASDYTIYDILRAAEGELVPVACLSNSPAGCEMRQHCLTLPLWKELEETLSSFLKGKTLADLLSSTLPESVADDEDHSGFRQCL